VLRASAKREADGKSLTYQTHARDLNISRLLSRRKRFPYYKRDCKTQKGEENLKAEEERGSLTVASVAKERESQRERREKVL